MAKPGSDRDGAMVDKQAGKKVREPSREQAHVVEQCVLLCCYVMWLVNLAPDFITVDEIFNLLTAMGAKFDMI